MYMTNTGGLFNNRVVVALTLFTVFAAMFIWSQQQKISDLIQSEGVVDYKQWIVLFVMFIMLLALVSFYIAIFIAT